MSITRRQILSSMCALAGTPVAMRAEQSRNDPRQAASTLQTPAEPVSLSDYEPLARERIPHMAYEYVSGGAADEITLRWNREAFDRIRLRPRVLVDVSRLDTRVTLFGQEMPFPILLAPTAYHRLVHPEGELATVKGADAAGATLIASMLATTAVEDMAKVSTRPLWFQTYILKDRGFTRDLAQRAEGAGCKALCVTVDSPVVGVRNRDQRARFALPPEMERANLKGLMRPGGNLRPQEGDIYTPILDASLVWKEIDWLRSFARAPVLLKGILNPEDADRAVKSGASGIIVSNHGARNLDTVPATIDALPEVADKIAGRVPILMDSGVRRGTDVFKALALGATAVLIGRPYLYGLGMAGSEGVRRVVNILQTEFKVAMALGGRPSLRDIDRSALWLKQP
jgi:4-hydroxymandelate oxidase